MDSLYHGPGWVPRPSFEADVDALLAERADLFVWLDLPYPLVLARVVRRTVRRRLRREELWNGNQEGPLHTFFTDPEHIVRWSWQTRHQYRERVPAVAADRPDLP